ncbi:hypothetical protein DFP72DRAFT_1152273 [Ephemerocybe angulata]|uniref:Uncharacterized protein n=1 Tax=Ephemerocybe angulata TaxID=980116 RepID=A0A8H6LWK1_9AGAR|nr:hypothetical protein DFP72DRAFT_1152273 [Tulosesus angulatus]
MCVKSNTVNADAKQGYARTKRAYTPKLSGGGGIQWYQLLAESLTMWSYATPETRGESRPVQAHEGTSRHEHCRARRISGRWGGLSSAMTTKGEHDGYWQASTQLLAADAMVRSCRAWRVHVAQGQERSKAAEHSPRTEPFQGSKRVETRGWAGYARNMRVSMANWDTRRKRTVLVLVPSPPQKGIATFSTKDDDLNTYYPSALWKCACRSTYWIRILATTKIDALLHTRCSLPHITISLSPISIIQHPYYRLQRQISSDTCRAPSAASPRTSNGAAAVPDSPSTTGRFQPSANFKSDIEPRLFLPPALASPQHIQGPNPSPNPRRPDSMLLSSGQTIARTKSLRPFRAFVSLAVGLDREGEGLGARLEESLECEVVGRVEASLRGVPGVVPIVVGEIREAVGGRATMVKAVRSLTLHNMKKQRDHSHLAVLDIPPAKRTKESTNTFHRRNNQQLSIVPLPSRSANIRMNDSIATRNVNEAQVLAHGTFNEGAQRGVLEGV